MATATSLWGEDASCPTTPANSNAKQATCNGNGNGRIDDYPSTLTQHEALRLWQHLANAGMISGTYTGARFAASDPWSVRNGINVPPAPLDAIFFAHYYDLAAGDSTYFPMQGHFMRYARPSGTAQPDGMALSAPDAKIVDVKTDDGVPGMGSVMAIKDTACATSTTPASAEYQTSDEGLVCRLVFSLSGF